MDPTCIFCRIVRGEIPAAKVLETDRALAILDINPVNPGHTLILPKPHHSTLSELPEELSAHVAAQLPRLCRAIRAATGAAGLNVVLNHGVIAGQTIHHVHWHILPRHSHDHVHWPWPHVSYAEGELARLQTRIADALTNPPDA